MHLSLVSVVLFNDSIQHYDVVNDIVNSTKAYLRYFSWARIENYFINMPSRSL